MLTRNAILRSHRTVKPTGPFVAVDGQLCSDTCDNRLWDAYWIIIQKRHEPRQAYEAGLWGPEPCGLDPEAGKALAREAARLLRDWYTR